MDTAAQKRRAAVRAAALAESGTVIGLGHGSTAAFAVREIADRVARGDLIDIAAVPCSNEVAELAARLGIRLVALDEHPVIDLTIDGADEVDPQMDLIKGGGGALLREKVVAFASRREIIVVDRSKLSERLGTRFALPIEVVPFAAATEERFLASLGAQVSRRGGDRPFRTDQGNVILDARWPGIEQPEELARLLDARPGIVGHGLFLDLATDLVVADESKTVHIERGTDWRSEFER